MLFSRENFHLYCQQLIENYYLQPFTEDWFGYRLKPRRKKQNLKNGFIERETYGAMHAARVCLYVEILHQMLVALFDEPIHTGLNPLKSHFGMSEVEIILLTRYVALGLNAGRSSRSRRCVEQSQRIICIFLQEHGVQKNSADWFSRLVQDKAELWKMCAEKGLPDTVTQGLDYLRKLIYLSERLDTIQHEVAFDFGWEQDVLADIPGYVGKKHQPIFFDLAVKVALLIRAQYDLLYPVRITGPDDRVMRTSPMVNHSFSIQRKLRFEHAENVLSETVCFITEKFPFFAAYLQAEVCQPFSLRTIRQANDPFLHGTTSRILPFMALTGWQLMSPMDMVEGYLLGVPGGELIRGGLRVATDRCEVCTGRLSVQETQGYNLEKIIRSYAHNKSDNYTLNEIKQMLDGQVSKAPGVLFSNINIILIFSLRYRQLGGDLSPYRALTKDFSAVIHVFYLYLVLIKYIWLDLDKLNRFNEKQKQDLTSAIYHHFNVKRLIEKIQSQRADIKACYDDPTKDHLNQVLQLLEMPVQSTVKTGYWACDKEEVITLCETQIFKVAEVQEACEKKLPEFCQERELTSAIHYICQNLSGYSLGSLLVNAVRKIWYREQLALLESDVANYIRCLQNRFETLERCYSRSPLSFSSEDQRFLDNPAPMILLYRGDKMQLNDKGAQEYRTAKLVLGEDIKEIATDTSENKQRLKVFLERHGLARVRVGLFSDLQRAKQALLNYEIKEEMDSKREPASFFSNRSMPRRERTYPITQGASMVLGSGAIIYGALEICSPILLLNLPAVAISLIILGALFMTVGAYHCLSRFG